VESTEPRAPRAPSGVSQVPARFWSPTPNEGRIIAASVMPCFGDALATRLRYPSGARLHDTIRATRPVIAIGVRVVLGSPGLNVVQGAARSVTDGLTR
jgi:hypothetical protein